MKRRTTLLAALAAPALLAAGRPAWAQDYPNRPIRLVTPSPPGGAGDVSNRLVALRMSELMGQPFVVENRVGANGVTAAMAALHGSTDGYTVFVGSTTTLVAAPFLMKSVPYDAAKDFAPVSLIGTLPFLLVVNNDLPVKSVKEFIAYGKANPGKLSYASPNVSAHVSATLFERMAGIQMLYVPYNSAPASLNDVISGQVASTFVDIPSALGLVQSGRLRVIGITSTKRIGLLPQVPTIAEAGVPGYELVGWTAMTVPAGVDPAIVRRLSEAAQKVLGRQDVRDQLAKVGFDGAASTPEELGTFMRSERPRWGQMIRDTGIQPE